MFEFTNDKYIYLMFCLARENIANNDLNKIKAYLNEIDLKKFFCICKEHELHGVVGVALENGKFLSKLPKYWDIALANEKTRLSHLKQKAIELTEIMYQNGIKMVILKNGGIMLDMIDDFTQCPMDDIDSLVSYKDFKKAHSIILKNGFTFKFRSQYEFEKLENAFRNGSTEYYIDFYDGTRIWFELSCRAIAGRWIRHDLEPSTDELLSRSYFAENTHAAILSPEDNLLQVCVHTAKHSYVRPPGLRLHLDVERIVAHCRIDWDLFLKKCVQVHVKTAAYFSLYIPSIIFGTPIPIYVLQDLKPSDIKLTLLNLLLKNAGLLHPKEKKFSKIQFIIFQALLYDNFDDMLKVIYPGSQQLKKQYGYSFFLLTPFYFIIRICDLVGIRKKKNS